jgi:hypothetical protein
MSNRKLAAGAFVSLLLSLAAYAAIAGALAGWFYAATFLPNPEVIWSPSPAARVLRFLFWLGWFVPAICTWWLTVFLAGRRRQAAELRLRAPADLWLLLAALIWSLMIFAIAMGRFPLDYHDCGQFMQLCTRPTPLWFWGLTGLAAAIFLFGLVQRVKVIGRPGPPAPDQVSSPTAGAGSRRPAPREGGPWRPGRRRARRR